jgi:hypothetical protein
MSRVYLVVEADLDDDYWNIPVICNTLKKAEKEKLKLEQQKEEVLGEYLTRYGNEYYQDLGEIQCDDLLLTNEELYDEIVNRVYLYQARHSILSREFKIQEREVI